MKKFFSLVLALVMTLSLTTVAWGAEDAPAPDANGVITLVAGTEYNKINLTGRTDVKKIIGNDAEVAGIYIDSGDLDGLYVENVVLTDLFHFEDGAVSNVTIVGCTFSGDARLALGLGSGSVSNVTVSGCEFNNMTYGAGAIFSNTSGAIEFIGNVFDTSNKHAISLSGTVGGNIMVKGNEFIDIAEAAIRVDDTASDVVLAVQNNVADNVTYAIKAEDVPATVKNWNNAWDGGELLVAGSANAALADIGSGVTTDGSGKFTGGTFAAAPAAADVASTHTVIQNTAGTYTVIPNTAGSNTAPLYDLHKANAASTEIAGDIAYVTVAASKNEITSGGSLEYIKMDGKLFVKIAAADATTDDYFVSAANQKTALFYVKQIDSVAEISYSRTGVEFTNIGAKCGQMNVPYTFTVAELGFYSYTNPVTKAVTYFVDYDADFWAADGYVTDAPYFNDGTITGRTNILVGDKIADVLIINATQDDSVLNQHVWSPVSYDKTTPTKALCGLCGAQANLYKLNKTPAGSVIDTTITVGSTDYNVVITSAGGSYVPVVGGTTTPSTDKVTSADTFDAGIAMYVGMSVMAAAGSAVVLKKRED